MCQRCTALEIQYFRDVAGILEIRHRCKFFRWNQKNPSVLRLGFCSEVAVRIWSSSMFRGNLIQGFNLVLYRQRGWFFLSVLYLGYQSFRVMVLFHAHLCLVLPAYLDMTPCALEYLKYSKNSLKREREQPCFLYKAEVVTGFKKRWAKHLG